MEEYDNIDSADEFESLDFINFFHYLLIRCRNRDERDVIREARRALNSAYNEVFQVRDYSGLFN